MLTGKPPFNGRRDEEIMEKIKKGEFNLEMKTFISKDAKDLITKMLTYDP